MYFDKYIAGCVCPIGEDAGALNNRAGNAFAECMAATKLPIDRRDRIDGIRRIAAILPHFRRNKPFWNDDCCGCMLKKKRCSANFSSIHALYALLRCAIVCFLCAAIC
jgi:hypothetical protein